ncbi:MAG: hypothetical protein IKD26_02170 [Clostridia bacterium]|nr:hypothetical protein [Clostridia bacterium]
MERTNKRMAVTTDEFVFGLAIHYFEEDSIVGNLYNLDGTPYKIVVPKAPMSVKTSAPIKTKTKQEQAGQCSLFDIFDTPTNEPMQAVQEPVVGQTVTTQTVVEQPAQGKIQPQTTQKVVAKQPSQTWLKYKEMQDAYPDFVIAIRLGDFYEVFGENAKVIARELDLTLTTREVGLPERMLMIGFPYHAKDVYIEKIRKNHKVAVGSCLDDLEFYVSNEDTADDFDLGEEEMRLFDTQAYTVDIDTPPTTYAPSTTYMPTTNKEKFDVGTVEEIRAILGSIVKVG